MAIIGNDKSVSKIDEIQACINELQNLLDEAKEKNLVIDQRTSRVSMAAPTRIMTITITSLVSGLENSIIEMSNKDAFKSKESHGYRQNTSLPRSTKNYGSKCSFKFPQYR